MPEWLQERLEALKWIAGSLGTLAVSVGAYTSLGGPIPATRDWVASYYEGQEERQNIRNHIRAITKALDELEDGPARDALIEQRDELELRLADLEP